VDHGYLKTPGHSSHPGDGDSDHASTSTQIEATALTLMVKGKFMATNILKRGINNLNKIYQVFQKDLCNSNEFY